MNKVKTFQEWSSDHILDPTPSKQELWDAAQANVPEKVCEGHWEDNVADHGM